MKIFSSLWLGSAWWSREQGCLPLSSGFLIKTHYSPHTKSSLSNDLSGSQIVSLTRLLSYFVVCGPLHITKYTELLHRQTGKSLFYHFCDRIVISAVLVCYIFSSIKFCKLSTHFKSKSSPKSVFKLCAASWEPANLTKCWIPRSLVPTYPPNVVCESKSVDCYSVPRIFQLDQYIMLFREEPLTNRKFDQILN